MKKCLALILVLCCILTLTACGGNVKGVQIINADSEVYTEAEIDDAIDTAIDYFKKEFSGCTLTEITYIGDEENSDYQEFADRNGADDVIVLVSSFDVDASGGDGSLNANSTYTNWKWILARGKNGRWEHVDHGY